MSKDDELVGSENDDELLIYEEWQRYVEEVNWRNEKEWEAWINSVGWSD